jgi:nitrite reductase/ring-hydroxylating ferredoxin subunit
VVSLSDQPRTGLHRMMAFGSDAIPRERFTSREFLDLEQERLWPRVWQVAGRLEELREVGDYLEYAIGDQSVLVVRTGTDVADVHGYLNTCLHRGTRLACGAGHFSGEIRCPFHGWRWDIHGRSTGILDRFEFPPMSDEDLCLPQVRVELWGGFVFVNLDAGAPPLAEYLEDVPGWLDPYRPERMRLTTHTTTVVPANWKVVVDAFNEGYHLAATHPEILRWKDDAAMFYEAARTHTRYGGAGWPMPSRRLRIPPEAVDQQQVLALKIQDLIDSLPGYYGPSEVEALREVARTPLPEGMTAGEFYLRRRRDGAAARDLDWSHLSDEQVLGGDDVLIFPNFLGPAIAGGWFTYRVRPDGLDPDSSIFEIWTLEERAPGAPESPPCARQRFADWRDHDWGLVVNQDLANFERIQQGLHTRGPGLRWNPRQEQCVRRFHEVLDRYLFDAPT